MNFKSLLLLTVLTVLISNIFSCEGETLPLPMPCSASISQVGEILEDCFHHQEINHEFSPFRDSWTVDIDLENDGEIDLHFLIEDTSFGVAGPGSGNLGLFPLVDNIEFGRTFTEAFLCNRFEIIPVPNQDPIINWLCCQTLCSRLTEEELNEADSIYTQDFSDFMARPFSQDEEITDQIEWHSDSISISRPSLLRGEFPFDEPAFVLLRKTDDGETRYGWIKVMLDNEGYSVSGELISTGMVKQSE